MDALLQHRRVLQAIHVIKRLAGNNPAYAARTDADCVGTCFFKHYGHGEHATHHKTVESMFAKRILTMITSIRLLHCRISLLTCMQLAANSVWNACLSPVCDGM